MYIKDGRLMDIEGNAPSNLRKVNATDIQITNFINDRVKPIREIVNNANQNIDAIANNISLSEHGRKQEVDATKRQAWELISETSDKTNKLYNAYIEKLSKSLSLSEFKGNTDKTIEYLQQQELRAALYEINKEDLIKIYMGANETGENMALITAIENNPMNSIKPLLDVSQIEKGRQIRIERENPEAILEINLVSTMASIAQNVVQKAKQALIESGGLKV